MTTGEKGNEEEEMSVTLPSLNAESERTIALAARECESALKQQQ